MLSPGEVSALYKSIKNTYDTPPPPMTELDREIRPILADVVTLEVPGNKKHPAVEQLYNRMVDPQCTGQEFCYVIGPMLRYVHRILSVHFLEYMSGSPHCIYATMAAAEALAMRCPILVGPWEQVAWILVQDIINTNDMLESFSNSYIAWNISMIGNPDFCPNPYLRIELMQVLIKHNEHKYLIHNSAQVLYSVLSACSSLTIEYLVETDYGEGRVISLDRISDILTNTLRSKKTIRFDSRIAEQLLDVKESRLSSVVHDIASYSTVNCSTFTQPTELHGITALLKTISGSARRSIKISKEADYMNKPETLFQIVDAHHALCVLLSNFSKSCQTPQLVNLTAACIMDVLELVISVCGPTHPMNWILGDDTCADILNEINQLLKKLLGGRDNLMTTSPLCLGITNQFYQRLKYLEREFQLINVFNDVSMIRTLMECSDDIISAQ